MNITIDNNSGGLAFWSSIEDCHHNHVLAAAQAAGIEKFVPAQTPPSTALRTAMEDVARQLFGRRRHEPLSIVQTSQPCTFECVRIVRGNTDNEHRFLFSASVDSAGVVTVLRPSGTHIDDDTRTVYVPLLSSDLQHAVHKQLTILPGPTVTRVLASGLSSWGCQSLHDRGGLWFLPSHRVAAYEAWSEVFRQNTSCRFVLARLDVSHNPAFVEHLANEVRADVLSGIHEITQDMLNAQGGMQDRSIRLRMEKAQEFLRKIEQYEAITDVTMQDMRDAIEKTKQALSIQKLMAAAV